MSMNDISLTEITNQQLLLGHNTLEDCRLKDIYYHEIVDRIIRWNVLTGQRTHMPRQVIIDLFRRHMRQNDIIIPPDRVEGKDREDFDGVDWFMGEDEDEDLFKI